MSRDVCQRIIEEVYIPGIRKYFPEALEELRGIADGAGLSLQDIVLINARYDLARVRGKSIRPYPGQDASSIAQVVQASSQNQNGLGQSMNGLAAHWQYLEDENASPAGKPSNGQTDSNDNHEDDTANECTTAGFLTEATANGDVIVAQNWDMSANIYLSDTAIFLEVHPDPSEDLPIIFVTTEAGQLGRSGMNSAGLGVCASSLMSTEDYFPIDLSLPPGAPQQPLVPMSLIRRQFLHNSNFANALINVRNMPRHVSNNLTVGTADSFVMALEITPSVTHLVYPEGNDNFIVHANIFVSTSFHASPWSDRYPGGSSWFRGFRVTRNVRPYNQGGLTEKRIIQAFSDHLSMLTAVCQHMEDCTVKNVPDYPYKGAQTTLGHFQYNLTQRTITTCKGPSCVGRFEKFEIKTTSNV